MLNLDKPIVDMLKSRAGTVINLYELIYHLAGEPICFTSDSENIEYQCKQYARQAIKHSDISYKTDGSVEDVTLTIGNAERQMQYYIERYDLLHKRVSIKQLYISITGEILGDMAASYIIKAIQVTNSHAVFTLSVGFDFYKAVVPRRRIFARFCSNAFKDSCCRYKGADTTCTKTFADCKKKDNLQNFGGFPGVKNERLYF